MYVMSTKKAVLIVGPVVAGQSQLIVTGSGSVGNISHTKLLKYTDSGAFILLKLIIFLFAADPGMT